MLVYKKRKHLILNLKEPGRVTTVIPQAKTLSLHGKTLVAVKHGIDETRILRNLGLDAPSPIGYYYDWPGRYSPFAHQKITAEFLTLNPRAFLLNGLGSGKTMSVLWAFDYLRRQGLVTRMLVISPLSTLERAWGDEIFRNFPEMSFAVLHGTKDKRHKLLALEHDVYIINHDGIKSKETLDLIKRRDDIDLIVIDEIASFRNAQTERWKALNALVNGERKTGAGRRDWVWGLTGTPTPNAPTDAWAQVRLINPTKVPAYYGQFRDRVMRQQGPYKWTIRDGAMDAVKDAMQPSVRFSREECIDLPPTTYVTRQCELTPEQKRAFDDMLRKLRAEHDGGQITAVNEGVKLSKLLQICCLRYDTNVLTDRGWVPISEVTCDHLVWDGVEWVSQKGAMPMGVKPTVVCAGVEMTPDHLVLSTKGWITAEEFNDGYASKRLDRASVRLPDGHATGREQLGSEQKGTMGVPMSVRAHCGTRESVPPRQKAYNHSELRLLARQSETWHGKDSPLPHLGEHASPLRGPERQRLGELRWPWDRGLCRLGQVIRHVLARYAKWIQPASNTRPQGQQRPLLAAELPVGNAHPTGEQPQVKPVFGYSERSADAERGGACVRREAGNFVREAEPVQVAAGESAGSLVYDLIDCGPRNRFVVRGSDGRPLIVHNCGVAYGATGEIALPNEPRLKLVEEIVEEAEAKVIVFVPLTGALHMVAQHLRDAGYSVATVNGETSKTERDRIFKDFQQGRDPRVLVANAGTMSHGLTLTAANTVVWFAPVHSLETYEQACARVTRPGQKRNTLIVNIEATALERSIYARLQSRGRMQGLLLDLIKKA